MNHVVWMKKLLVWVNSLRHLFQQRRSMFAVMHTGKNSWNLRESELDEVWLLAPTDNTALSLTCSFLLLRSLVSISLFSLFLSFLPYLSTNFEHWSVVLFPSFESHLCIRILFLSPFLWSGHSLPSTLFLCSFPLSLKYIHRGFQDPPSLSAARDLEIDLSFTWGTLHPS